MLSSQEIEKEFYRDIRYKKRVGTGAFYRKGKGKKHRIWGVKTSYDFLTPGERKKLNGEVKVYNIYETIMPINEFERLEEDRQRELLIKWRERHKNVDIHKKMGVSDAKYYRMLSDLGITNGSQNGKSDKDKKPIDLRVWMKKNVVIPYHSFKLLPVEQQVELFEFYRMRTNYSVLTKYWKVSKGTLYTLAYNLKKEKEKMIVEGKYDEERKRKQFAEIIQEIPELKEDVDVDADIREEVSKTVEKQKQAVPAMDLDKLLQAIEKNMEHKIQEMINQSKTKEHHEPTQEAKEETYSMDMVYQKTTEGFEAYNDLRQFIQVLHKNPDMFEIELTIKRKN